MRNLTILCTILMLAVLGLGNKGCEPDPDAPPPEPLTVEQTADAIKLSMDKAITDIEDAEALTIAFTGKGPEFDPCMVADVSKDNLRGVKTWVDPIAAESANPDCELTLPSYTISVARCLALEDKPDPWPPEEPNETAITAIKAGVPAVFNNVDFVLDLAHPNPEGQTCVNKEIWKAVSGGDDMAVQGAITGLVPDVAQGKEEVTVPGFTINYGGCGLECGTETKVTPLETP